MINLETVINFPNKENYTEFLFTHLSEGVEPIVSKKIWNLCFLQFNEAMHEGKFLSSVNMLSICVLTNYEKTFEYLRKKGTFRYSNYCKKRSIVAEVSEFLIKLVNRLNKDDYRNLNYLRSVITFQPLHREYQIMYGSISKYLTNFHKKYKASPTKSLVALVDYLFLTDYSDRVESNENTLSYYSKEQIGEAISFIIFIESELFEFNQKIDLLLVHDTELNSKELRKVLLLACKYKAFQELELLIEFFDYTCTTSPVASVQRSARPNGFIRAGTRDDPSKRVCDSLNP